MATDQNQSCILCERDRVWSRVEDSPASNAKEVGAFPIRLSVTGKDEVSPGELTARGVPRGKRRRSWR